MILARKQLFQMVHLQVSLRADETKSPSDRQRPSPCFVVLGPQVCTRIWERAAIGPLKKLLFDWPIRLKGNSNWTTGNLLSFVGPERGSLNNFPDVNIRSLKKQPTFRDVTTSNPAKWRLRNVSRNSILMTCLYPHLGSASDWLSGEGYLLQPIRSTTQPDLGGDTSSVWNVCCRSSHAISRENQGWCREMSPVLSGYTKRG